MEAKVSPEREHAVFSLTVEADDIEPGKIAVRDLARLSELVQRGLERTARVLSGQPGSAPGRLPRTIEDATRLVLIGIGRGSAVLQLELPEPVEAGSPRHEEPLFAPPARDLGFRAMDTFVRGLHEIEQVSDAGAVPDGWDSSVMEVARGLAEVVEERNIALTFDARPPDLSASVARMTPQTAPRLRELRAPVRRRRTARGRLIAVDLTTGRVDVQEAAGGRVSCHYGEALESAVKRHLGVVVVASGEEDYDEALRKHGRLELDSLEGASEQMGFEDTFWLNRSAAEQAAQQGVGPIESIDELAASDLFTDREIDAFLAVIHEARRE
ncbi:MAG: hypothetical protein ABI635_05645 [Actinomycetota bacterium]